MTIFIRFATAKGVVDIDVDADENGSFHNQTEDVASKNCSSRSAARKAASAWKELHKKKPRGWYVANTKPMSDTSSEFEANRRRSAFDIATHATKELESLAHYTPDLSDTDARVLALRLYYIDGVSPNVTQDKVSKMFMVSSRTVKRWAASWEAKKPLQINVVSPCIMRIIPFFFIVLPLYLSSGIG